MSINIAPNDSVLHYSPVTFFLVKRRLNGRYIAIFYQNDMFTEAAERISNEYHEIEADELNNTILG